MSFIYFCNFFSCNYINEWKIRYHFCHKTGFYSRNPNMIRFPACSKTKHVLYLKKTFTNMSFLQKLMHHTPVNLSLGYDVFSFPSGDIDVFPCFLKTRLHIAVCAVLFYRGRDQTTIPGLTS